MGDPTKPWRAPGTAPIRSNGIDGRNLPKKERTVWQRGTTVQAAWAIYQNHGGGYQYRLCPASVQATEACFQQHPLPFADSNTIIHWTSGREVTIPAHTTAQGTTPAGSQYRRNPIPNAEGGAPFPPPCQGCQGDMNDFSLIDHLIVPTSLAAGDYVLSWRWDCEVTSQVWLNCGDVTITAGDENKTVVV